MRIPNVEHAVIAEDKRRDSLLNVEHGRGSSKARMLIAMGYRAENWPQLATDIRAQHLTLEVDVTKASDYGARYEIVGPMVGPQGWSAICRSVWQIDIGTDYPRLITMYPE
ncbi:MAG: hypothetical protein HY000_09740 [Planctomycetes bacterium]|nr:hypothetical protein [Planctomycetota bacterium]